MLVTLCGLQLYTGLAYGITGGPAINGVCDAFKNIANGTVAGIPYVLFIFIAVVAVVVFIMKCTVFGHEIYFLGSNAQAAMYSGHQHAESHDYDLYVLRYPGRYFRVS